MIVIDTDILIDVGRGVEDALSYLQQEELNKNSFAISIVTKMELVVGCRDKQELRYIEKFLEKFILINLNEKISIIADELLITYRLSHGLLIADTLIAATAISQELPLISKNQRDYRFIKKLNLLPYPTY